MKLIITLKKAGNCWLAKFNDDQKPEFSPTPYSEKASSEKVIKGLSKLPLNFGAKFIIEE